MSVSFLFKTLLILPFISTIFMYIGSYYLSKITNEGIFTPSLKTLWTYFFRKNVQDIKAVDLKNFYKFKLFIFIAQLFNCAGFVVFMLFINLYTA